VITDQFISSPLTSFVNFVIEQHAFLDVTSHPHHGFTTLLHPAFRTSVDPSSPYRRFYRSIAVSSYRFIVIGSTQQVIQFGLRLLLDLRRREYAPPSTVPDIYRIIDKLPNTFTAPHVPRELL
jgi:hypothetical protein